jgi:hypothetical protein
MRDPALAGILSFIIPGVGQLYNGRILAGVLWLIITPGMWIGSGAGSAGSATSLPLIQLTLTRKSIPCECEYTKKLFGGLRRQAVARR